jgi:hypothetical protein
MKKLMLYLVGMLAMALFATDASAIPAFARQTGMACSACHYQHFPAITAFGRSFKENGYTMIGSQEKVEGDGVSLPVVLNAALVGYMSYEKTNGQSASNGTAGSRDSNDGSLQIPQQVSLFMGGRAGEHIGFEAEVNLNNSPTTTNGSGYAGGGTGTGNAGLLRLKVPFVYDVGSVKAGIVPFSTQGLGVADSFEVLNTGAVAVHVFNQADMPAFSAQQYIGTGTNAHGVAFIASNDDFFANFAKWGANSGGGLSGSPTSNYLRAAWTTGAISGFDSAIGFQVWNGTSALDNGSGPDTWVEGAGNCPGGTYTAGSAGWGNCSAAFYNGIVDTKAWAIDAQMMGDVGGMPLTLIASYAKAPAQGSNLNPNLFNANAMDKSSFNIGAELGLIPNKATVQLAFRHASSGNDAGVVAGGAPNGSNASDNAVVIGATYAFALNVRSELTYSKYSGDMYGAAVQAANPGVYTGDNRLYLDLAFGF